MALTAHDDPDMKARALQAGMGDYLVKPLSSSMAQEILIKYSRKVNADAAPSALAAIQSGYDTRPLKAI